MPADQSKLPPELMAKVEAFKDIIRQCTKDKPKTSEYFENMLGLSGEDVRKIAHWLNIQAFGLCSCRNGYFYSEDIEILRDYRDSLIRRGESIISRALGVGVLIKQLEAKRDHVGPQGELL